MVCEPSSHPASSSRCTSLSEIPSGAGSCSAPISRYSTPRQPIRRSTGSATRAWLAKPSSKLSTTGLRGTVARPAQYAAAWRMVTAW